MTDLPGIERAQPVARQRPTGIDLILQARAMRRQWFASAFARLPEKLARFGAELVARPRPSRTRQPAAPLPPGFSGRPAT